MDSPRSPNAPKRRVGVYERLGRSASASPARTISIGIVALAIIIVLMVVLSRSW